MKFFAICSVRAQIVKTLPCARSAARLYAQGLQASLKTRPQKRFNARALGRARFDVFWVNLRRGTKYIFRTARVIQIQF